MLENATPIPTIPARDMERARAFYRDKLGLEPEQDMPEGALYKCGTSWFWLYPLEIYPDAVSERAPSTTLVAWMVNDLTAATAALRERGVTFEEYDTPEVQTVDGVANVGLFQTAWFRDSEGNLLSVSQRQGQTTA